LTHALFGTDGMRGRAGEEPLTATTLERLGQVLAAQLCTGSVLIGHDGRESGETLVAALAAGLSHGGIHVDILGLATTPCIAYLTMAGEYAAGIVVSASHNPAPDNGVKLLGATGAKLDGATEQTLEGHLQNDMNFPPAETPGEQRRVKGLVGDYIAWLRNDAFPELDFGGAKVALDCAHGAASQIGSRILKAFGAEAVILHDKPDGRNINDQAGALYPEKLAGFAQEHQCALGISLDGDADRGILVDGDGRVLDGDAILAGMALALAEQKGLKTVVATVMSNLALEQTLHAVGIHLLRTPVGDRHVAAAMKKHDYSLGGEKSGHILFGKEHGFRGDGIYTLLRIADILWRSGARGPAFASAAKKFAADYEDLPQELRNLPATKRVPLEELPCLQEALQSADALLAGRGRTVVRFSGTELKLRLMVEAMDQDLVTKALDILEIGAQQDGILA